MPFGRKAGTPFQLCLGSFSSFLLTGTHTQISFVCLQQTVCFRLVVAEKYTVRLHCDVCLIWYLGCFFAGFFICFFFVACHFGVLGSFCNLSSCRFFLGNNVVMHCCHPCSSAILPSLLARVPTNRIGDVVRRAISCHVSRFARIVNL